MFACCQVIYKKYVTVGKVNKQYVAKTLTKYEEPDLNKSVHISTNTLKPDEPQNDQKTFEHSELVRQLFGKPN